MVGSQSRNSFFGHKLEARGLTRFLLRLFARKTRRMVVNSPGKIQLLYAFVITPRYWKLVFTLFGNVTLKRHLFKKHKIELPTVAMGRTQLLNLERPNVASACTRNLRDKNTKTWWTQTGHARAQSIARGQAHLLNLLNYCQAHWVIVLCTHACRVRAYAFSAAWSDNRTKTQSAVWTCKTVSRSKPEFLYKFCGFWILLVVLPHFDLYIPGCTRYSETSSHEEYYPRTNKSIPKN